MPSSNFNLKKRFQILSALIREGSFKVISFDIFETLLYRPTIFPGDVFYLVSERAKEIFNNTQVDFFAIRSKAESELKMELENTFPDFGEVSINMIYHYISEKYNLEKSKCSELCAEEIAIEKQLLQVRRDIFELYKTAMEEGKRVIAVSDIYLEEDVLNEILMEKGVSGLSGIYSSCTRKKRKDTGELFKFVVESEGINPDEILHIGDNYFSDFMKPRELLIVSFHYPSLNDLIFSHLSVYSHIWGDVSCLDPRERLLIALALKEWFSKNEVFYFEDSVFQSDPKLLGFLGIGPLLLYMVLRIINNNEIQSRYRKIYFASRDGYLPQKAYDVIASDYNVLKSDYLYCGRRAYDIYRCNNAVDYILNYTDVDKGISLRLLLELLFKPDYVLYKKFISHFSGSELDSAYYGYRDKLKDVVVLYEDQINNYLMKLKNNALCYYTDKLFSESGERGIVFDVGYNGSVSKAIGALTGIPLDKIYLHQEKNNIIIDAEHGTETWVLLQDFYGLRKELPGFYLLFEELFSSTEPPCIGFTETSDKKYIPVLDDEEFSSDMKRELYIIQDSILDYISSARSIFGKYINFLNISEPRNLLKPLLSAFKHNDKYEELLLKNIVFSDKFFYKEDKTLSHKLYDKPLVQNLRKNKLANELRFIKTERNLITDTCGIKIAIFICLFDLHSYHSILEFLFEFPVKIDVIIIMHGTEYRQNMVNIFNRQTIPMLGSLIIDSFDDYITKPILLDKIKILLNYDLVCTINTPGNMTDSSHYRCMLSRETLSDIIPLFSINKKLGILYPANSSETIIIDRENEKRIELALNKMMLLRTIERSDVVFCSRSMFWFRPEAVVPQFTLDVLDALFPEDLQEFNFYTLSVLTQIAYFLCDVQDFEIKFYLNSDELLSSFKELQNAKNIIDEKEYRIEELNRELTKVTGSRVWRWGKKIADMNEVLFPKNSIRRKLIKKLLKRIKWKNLIF